jgi:hypothetical protein
MRRYSIRASILALAVAAVATQVGVAQPAAPRPAAPRPSSGPRNIFKPGFVGTWESADRPAPQVYIFTVHGDTLGGIACGPCDDIATLTRVTDGAIAHGDRATFYLADAGSGSPDARNHARQKVTAVLSDGVLTVTRAGRSTQLRRPTRPGAA